MSEPQHISTHAHELEAHAILSQDYDECETEDVMKVYRTVVKHIGFVDTRRDKRFIVKFHDVFFYEPEELDKDTQELYDELFQQFCEGQYAYIMDELKTESIRLEYLLSERAVGHYRPFNVYIPEITQDNAVDIAREIYDNVVDGYHAYYADEYIYIVELLQDLEDNYMTYWIEFLRDNEFPEEYVEQIEERYNNNNHTKEK